MSTIGSVGTFNPNVEDLESYCERVDLYFDTNSIVQDKKGKAFLSLSGPQVYALTKSLLSPQLPSADTYL